MYGVLACVMSVGWVVHLHGWRVRVSDVPWILEFKVILKLFSEQIQNPIAYSESDVY